MFKSLGILILSLFFVTPVFSKPNNLTVIALSDFHGALPAHQLKTADGKTIQAGGAALVSTYVKRIRKNAKGPVVIVDGGDVFQGTMVSNRFEGAPVVKFYNHIGVTASVVGNHEFDYGPSGKNSVPKKPDEDPRGAIKDRVRQASFPFLAANMFDDYGTRPEWAKPSVLVEVDGMKVGVVGAATPSTPHSTVAKNLVGLNFMDPLFFVVSEADKLRALGADHVILSIHEGVSCDGCKKGKIVELIEGIARVQDLREERLFDLIVGGHSHRVFGGQIHGIPYVQAGSRGYMLGVTELSVFDDKDTLVEPKIIEVCGSVIRTEEGIETCNKNLVKAHTGEILEATFLGEKVVEDPEVVELLRPDFDSVRKIKSVKIGVSAVKAFERNYLEENALGNLTADLFKFYINELSEQEKVDIGMTNNGGLRAGLPAGILTYGDIYNVMPFDNALAVFTVNGITIRKMIELGIARVRNGLSWSGVEFSASACKVQEVAVNGSPIENNRIYRIVSNNYLAGGGSGFSTLNLGADQIEMLDGEPNLRDAMVEALPKWNKDLKPEDYFSEQKRRQKIGEICPKVK